MRLLKISLRVLLSVVQTIVFFVPFVLNYYGSHTMGAHRHFKVRGDVYASGILNSVNLAIAAIAIGLILVLMLCLLYTAIKQRPQPIRLWSLVPGVAFTAALFLVLILPAARSLLIFPWLVFCAALVWILQLIKVLLLERKSVSVLMKSFLTKFSGAVR